MHPWMALGIWNAVMLRAAAFAPAPAKSVVRSAALPAANLGAYLVTDVTTARLPDPILDSLGELYWTSVEKSLVA